MQTEYNDMVASIQGGLGDAGHHDIVSGVSAAIVLFGMGLAQAADGTVDVPGSTGFKFGGISMQKHNSTNNASGEAQYEIGDAISVLRKGRIWVYAEEAVNPTDPVFLRHTTATTENPGDFRTDADTARADDISAFAKWVGVTTAAGLAELEINAP